MFLENLLEVAKLVAILYIIAAIGFFADKIGKFTEKAARLATGLLFYIVTPCVIINSFAKINKNNIEVKELILSVVFYLLTYLIAIPLANILFKKQPSNKRNIYRYAAIYGNCGYLGLPMAQEVIGDAGVFYCSIGIAVFNVFAFTQGIYQINEDSRENAKISVFHILINPGTLGIFLGIPVFVLGIFGIQLPEVISSPIEKLGSMNTPLAMVCLGTYLAHTDIKKMITDKNNYIVALFRLLIIPACVFALLILTDKLIVRVPAVIAMSIMVSACPPSANNTVLFASNFDKNTGLASTTVASSTVMSIISMPVILALSQAVFPLT